MSLSILHYLCLVTLLSHNFTNCTKTDHEEPRRTFPFRRAIDGTRGRKFYDPEDDGFLHSYGSSGRYDPNHQANDFSDIRNNVPGEPGVDYPSYTRLPQTGFVCEAQFRGYYADEAAGCQVFHVCDGSFLVSSFLCPMGSIFSQKLLTCDWWSKVDCSATRIYHGINSQSIVSEADDDEILRKAFEMASVQSSGERIPAETLSQQREPEHQERGHRIFNYRGSTVTERSNDLQTVPDSYSDYPDYPSRLQSRFQSRAGQNSRQRYQEDDYYSQDVEEEKKQQNNPQIRVHTIGEDRRNDGTLKNEFQPSYAPTVPTVITTTRRFYSPTFPTTYRPSTERQVRGRFDLEVESSDHLYTAKGRSDETVKAATAPPVVSKITVTSKNITLPILVNSVDDRRYDVENMQESESSDKNTTVTVPVIRINATNAQSSTEPIVFKDGSDNTQKNTQLFSILTIDNENHYPDIFAYNREETTSPGNETNFEISSTSPELNSARVDSPQVDKKKSNKPKAFLEPPQKLVKQFRIMVLEESSTPKNDQDASNLEGDNENNSNSGVELIKSIEIPAIRITPSLFNGKEASKESPVIRIIINKDNTSKNSFGSINLESLTKKIASEDFIPLVEDSEGEHSETKIISKELPKVHEEVVNETTDKEKFRNNAETVSSTRVSSNDATSTSSVNKSSHSIDAINATVDLEKSRFNTISEVPVESSSTLSQVKKSEDHKQSEETLPNTETTISQEKSIEHSFGIEASLLSAEAIVSKKKINKDQEHSIASGDSLLNEKTMNFESNDSDNYERSSRNDEITMIGGNIEDSVIGGSSPFEVTLTVNKDEELDPNGELIRKLIAKHEIGDSIAATEYKSFEIVKSDESKRSKDGLEDPVTAVDSRSGRKFDFESNINEGRLLNFQSNNLQSRDYYRNIVGSVNGPNMPRPFSLESSQNIEVRTSSDISNIGRSTSVPLNFGTYRNDLIPVTTRISVQTTRQPIPSPFQESQPLEKLSASSKVEPTNNEGNLEQLSQSFGERQVKLSKEKIIFELPQEQRSLDFETGHPLDIYQKMNTRVGEESEDSKMMQKSNEKSFAKTVVETELIPSISFSLNTDEEREEYMEAVIKGLLPDIRVTESTNNDTNTSVES